MTIDNEVCVLDILDTAGSLWFVYSSYKPYEWIAVVFRTVSGRPKTRLKPKTSRGQLQALWGVHGQH